MNIFATNECPKQSAREHSYRHVVKMICESHQLLATAHRILDGDEYADSHKFCRKTHPWHPSTKWTRESSYHYKWLFVMLCELHKIYEQRSGKIHVYKAHLKALGKLPVNIPGNGFVMPTPAMPDSFKAVAIFQGRCVAYQEYLKSKFKEWQSRDKPIKVEFPCGTPDWMIDEDVAECA